MTDIKFIQIGGGLILKINNAVHILNADHGFSDEISVYFYTRLINTDTNLQEEL